MGRTILDVPESVHSTVWRHLLPPRSRIEQAAFGFARGEAEGQALFLRITELDTLGREDFASRASDYLELTDACSARLIKRAHDLGASLVEFHSHPGPWKAAFSPADMAGFREFVPHVWWRLKGKPYAAVVAARSGFDALVWQASPESPSRLSALRVGGRVQLPTGLTPINGGSHHG